jgi:hypothetical protein
MNSSVELGCCFSLQTLVLSLQGLSRLAFPAGVVRLALQTTAQQK